MIKKVKQDKSEKKNYMTDFSQAVDHRCTRSKIASYRTVVCFVNSALLLCVEMLLFSLS